MNITQIAARFWAKVDRSGGPDACWPWKAAISRPEGYGKFGVGSHVLPAHRVAYLLAKGPIPKGLTIDHLCRLRACMNPAHLEAVTQRENILRGNSPMARQARKTHCLRDHALDQENTAVKQGPYGPKRECITCRRARVRARRAAARAA